MRLFAAFPQVRSLGVTMACSGDVQLPFRLSHGSRDRFIHNRSIEISLFPATLHPCRYITAYLFRRETCYMAFLCFPPAISPRRRPTISRYQIHNKPIVNIIEITFLMRRRLVTLDLVRPAYNTVNHTYSNVMSKSYWRIRHNRCRIGWLLKSILMGVTLRKRAI